MTGIIRIGNLYRRCRVPGFRKAGSGSQGRERRKNYAALSMYISRQIHGSQSEAPSNLSDSTVDHKVHCRSLSSITLDWLYESDLYRTAQFPQGQRWKEREDGGGAGAVLVIHVLRWWPEIQGARSAEPVL